jgi:short chain dehydrogenase
MTATRPAALVAGASSGIGKATALALGAAGFQVIGTSRNTSRVTPRDGVRFLDLDVTGGEPASTVARRVTGRFGRIDVLASNAGAGTAGAAGESSAAQAQGVFDVSVFGLIRVTRAVLPHMRARERGRIIKHLLRTRVHPRSLHGRLRRVEARSRGLLRVHPQTQPAGRHPAAHPGRRRRRRRCRIFAPALGWRILSFLSAANWER